MKIPGAWTKLEASESLPKWWTEMSDESKKEYIAEHPNSKYAEIHKSAAPKELSSPHDNHAVDVHAPEMKAGSPARKKIGSFLRTKSKHIFDHLKHEAKEWKTAGVALKGLAQGKPLDDHGKKAIASVAADIAVTTTTLVTVGWAAHGVLAFLHHFGSHLAQEALMKAAIRGSMHVASLRILSSDQGADRIVQDAIEIMIDQIEKGDLEKYTEKKAVSARVDMSAEVVGRGLCPECKKPMAVVMAGEAKVWACAADRISIPVPDGYKD